MQKPEQATSVRRLYRVAAALALACAGLSSLPAQAAADSAKAQEALAQKGSVTIGIHNRAPWGYRDDQGEAVGFHPDLVRAALAPLGVKKIEFVVSEFGALIPGMMAKRSDMIASGIAITPQRCKAVIFSEPDLAVGDSLIVATGNPYKIHSYADIKANPKIRLGGGRGTLNTKNAIDAGVPQDQITQFQDTEALVSAVIAGRIDAATLSAPSVVSVLQDPKVKGAERALPFTGLIRNGVPAAMYTAIAFRPEDTALRDLYNQRLAQLKADGTVRKIMAKYGFTDDDVAPQAVTTEAVCDGKY
ncbi:MULTISPECIES: ectoine/hydroxyectoine ABC transporter substrate-binding protein EhuB [unclassified Achromobacter]|uniref:ectoine/hydroxyectoine ABC transporter substrate-binding protein EhuB n=1 Tax=unclassified Achromobacter TaxID=2626865 RepID=UPI000B51C9F9|nr:MULTISPECIES: ectoine/hydroxyectoine ABC transporter substrate-binding protein EhuB [unclassified Achromobacter]OWT69089.1 ectoine/hydroxyectoine ABC transporter substrate-binding protein EhuB [Achromobacter sp. HZ34]OWT70494.1 ectoine/hydroxyectoine ABC transporter substrate-binding protein EhuB [Achromobacter sp. HZ28]